VRHDLYNSDFAGSSGTSGYSEGESFPDSETACYILSNLLYSCTEGPMN